MRPLLLQLISNNWLANVYRLPATVALCLLLVIAQSGYLVHSHDGNLQSQFDCEICLKFGSSGDAILDNGPETFVNSPLTYFSSILTPVPFLAVYSAPPRGPPAS